MKTINIWTDGACSGNPGKGGWGALLSYDGNIKTLSGGEKETTNNKMELLAVISALRALKEPCVVKLRSDSAYVVNAFLQDWITNWQNNNWRNTKKQPVANKDLWLELIKLTSIHKVTFIKVQGHASDINNNLCDELARKAILKL